MNLRVQKATLLRSRFLALHDKRISLGESVLPYAGHLPRDFDARLIGFNRKAIVGYLGCYYCLRKLPDRGQMVTEIGIQGLKIIRQDDRCIAMVIRGHITAVEVHHFK